MKRSSPRNRLHLVSAAFLAAMLASPATSRADDRLPPSDAFATRLDIEIPLLAAGLALWTLPVLIDSEDERSHCAPCDRQNVNRLDRWVIGHRSHFADVTSDVLGASLPIGFAITGMLSDRRHPGQAAQDALLILESMVAAGVLNQLFRHVYVRPRPYMYMDPVPDDRFDGPEDWRSFFSGHTAQAFAAASAFATIYSSRRPGARSSPWVWAGSMGLASLMPIMRVASGEHFPTDVATGAAVGLSLGLAIPALHRRRAPDDTVEIVVGPSTMGVRGRF